MRDQVVDLHRELIADLLHQHLEICVPDAAPVELDAGQEVLGQTGEHSVEAGQGAEKLVKHRVHFDGARGQLAHRVQNPTENDMNARTFTTGCTFCLYLAIMRHTFFSQPMRPSSSKETSSEAAEEEVEAAEVASCLDLATTNSTESSAASTLEVMHARTQSLVDSSMNLKVVLTSLNS